MFNESTSALLKRPLIARMSVIDAKGFPHILPVWFTTDNNDLIITSFRRTRKIGYIKNNRKGAVQIGGEPADTPGYLFKGAFYVEEDPQQIWLKTITELYEPPETAQALLEDWANEDSVVLRLIIEKVIKVS